MAALVEEVAAYLDAQSTRLTVGATLFQYVLPETTAGTLPSVGVFETEGMPPRRHYGSGLPWAEQAVVEIVVRSTSPASGSAVASPVNARTLARDVWAILDKIVDARLPTSTGSRYLRVEAMQSPFHVGRDERGRHLFKADFLAWRTPSTSA